MIISSIQSQFCNICYLSTSGLQYPLNGQLCEIISLKAKLCCFFLCTHQISGSFFVKDNHEYNINQIYDENKEKYQFGDN